MLDGIGDGFCPARDLQLGEDIADVSFHSGDTDDHRLCDLLVALTLDHQIQHLPFAFGQVKPGMLRWAG